MFTKNKVAFKSRALNELIWARFLSLRSNEAYSSVFNANWDTLGQLLLISIIFKLDICFFKKTKCPTIPHRMSINRLIFAYSEYW